MKTVGIKSTVEDALKRAWASHELEAPPPSDPPTAIKSAVADILRNGSPPNRQVLLAIAAGTVTDPSSNPAALQQQAGVDRRGMAYKVRDALTAFRDSQGLTLKISQDAGVSNQWREPEITDEWVSHRRKQDQSWARAFLRISEWLKESDPAQRAHLLLDYVSLQMVALAVDSALDYPRFRATPRTAMTLVRNFLSISSDRPDAMEAVVTVAARVLSSALHPRPEVVRSDINSPDPIDIVITTTSDNPVKSGIEVTDAHISLAKIQHEVVPAMLKLGLDRATVVSRGTPSSTEREIEKYLARAFARFQQRIDLVTIDTVESWLSFPGTSRDLATEFLWGVGEELDQYSKNENRRAWFKVLTDFAETVVSDNQ